MRTLAAASVVLGVLGVGAYGVYADVERGERPEVAAPSITAKPPKLTSRRSARVRFTDRERGVSFRCSLDRAGWKACSSPRVYRGPLAAGRHRFRVRAVRRLGELELSSITSYGWTIDLRASVPRIVRHPSNPTSSSTATFAFADRERRVRLQCRLDARRWMHCRRRVTYRGIRAGVHMLLVRALDPPAPASRTARFRWRVVASNQEVSFSITAASVGPLYPGAAPVSIPVTLVNPNRVAIFVTSVVAVAGVGPAGCDPATNLRLVQSDASSARAVKVAAGGSVTLPAWGVSAPAIGLVDLPVNQDACRNVTFALSLTGSAHP